MRLPYHVPLSGIDAQGLLSRLARLLWVAPFLLSLSFTALVIVWAQDNDRLEREASQRTVMADTLSLDAQLAARLETETATLRAAAARLPAPSAARNYQMATLPEIAAGLDRRWLSVVWLDVNGRIIGEARRELRRGTQTSIQSPGITLHLVAPTSDLRRPQTGQLIARYDPADLIKSKDFWWLAAQYEVQLVSGQDQVILSTETPGHAARGESYEMPFQAIADARLRLTQRVRQPHWFATLPVVLMVGFLALVTIATWLLRRQMNRVAQAEAAWRTEAAWRQSMQESALVGLRARDLKGDLLFVNRTFCAMVGYSQDELAKIGPGFDEQVQNAGNPNRHRNKSEGQETRWRHRDGRAIDVMVFESPLVDGQGQQVGWMGSIVDVTERKRLEEMDRRQREALANHARLSTLGEVASTLAHELNQPLTSIVGYSAGIATALQKQAQPDTELIEAAQALAHHASQAGDIVHRIRARLARREPNYGYFEVNPIVTHAVTLLQRDLKRTGADVSLDLEEHLPQVFIDRIGIEQVISNLLRNASDAMSGKNGARTIVVRTRLSARARVGRSESWVSVEVTDSGTGLGGHDIETLTEPFFSTKQEGTGLGLAICRSILESHGGVLYAEDAPTGGARFGFALPPANPSLEIHSP